MSTAEPQLPTPAPTTDAAAVIASPQQHNESLASAPAAATTPQASSAAYDEGLNCQWSGCGERLGNAEALYDHVCERHVGRKSTNNLNLTCQWGACRTTTVKRDHITSHMRVHVPLKPHKCEFCGKSFKRPQDLKKHVKTHADDSVLLRSPDGNMNGQQNGQSYNGDNKAYFPGHDMNGNGYSGGQGHGVGGGFGNGYPNPGGYNGYGQVNYPGTSLADQQSMDTRRRAIEALNDFLGDVKRRALDPHTYYDVGQRLNTNALPLPVSIGQGYSIGNGYNGGHSHGGQQQHSSGFGSLMDSFGGAGQGLGVNQHAGGVAGPLTQNYQLPVSNARTKNDLLDIDRFLEQLQSTVYESSNQSAASGVQQPGIHPFGNFNNTHGYNTGFRSSHSPPHSAASHSAGASAASHGLSSIAQLTGMAPTSSSMDTPALTPSSVSSYASSGHSPMSSHSRSSGDGASLYPSLPSVSAMSDMSGSYSSAPPAGLASGFDGFDARRYSGGRLQREAPAPSARDENAMDVDDDGSSTPRKMSLIKEAISEGSTNVDPALRSPAEGESSPKSDSADDKAQEAWVENVRVIEQLRSWIHERLEKSDFERDADSTPEPSTSKQAEMTDAMDEASTPTMKDETEAEIDDAPVAYPTLKKEE